jgi:hypothetical protein
MARSSFQAGVTGSRVSPGRSLDPQLKPWACGSGLVSAVAAVLRVDPTVASTAFDVVRSGEEEYTAIFAHGRGFLIYWVPAGHELVLLEWLVWAD